jgi:hypothetical protein
VALSNWAAAQASLVFGDFITSTAMGFLFVVAEPDVRASGIARAEGCKGCTDVFVYPSRNDFTHVVFPYDLHVR